MSQQYPQEPQPPQQPSQYQQQPPQYQQPSQYQQPTPYGQQVAPVPPPNPHKTRNLVAAGSVGAIILVGLIGGAFSDQGGDQNAVKESKPAVATSAPPKDDSSAPAPVATTKAPTAPVASAQPAPVKTTPVKTTPVPPKPKPKPVVYQKLTSREWAKLVKSPDDHAGETILVYGVVTQFDAATGADGFLADSDWRRHSESYEYAENTVFQQEAGAGNLDDVVEGDFFTAKIKVLGSYSYETQIGGNTTVPSFEIVSVSVTGHED
ncbi:hypothetical protein [Streptomyces sp. SID13031]|uniref:hypothetical protein n=1 Tax=Streptomyces sp. SID13031 TaxID=2706046 RepID=UPI0013C65FDC|nr:hypothetical protein [Streptomyces sp. SID13031]NEA33784.1 hypothetical protein [Streptomyces sp. SID13031]